MLDPTIFDKGVKSLKLMHLYIMDFSILTQLLLAKNLTIWLKSKRGASDSVTNFSALSNPVDANNVSCLGLYGRDMLNMSCGLSITQLSVSITK